MVGFLKAFLGGASWGLKGYQSIPYPLKRMVFTTNKKHPLKFWLSIFD
ncbi:hypothetical protein hp2018_0090 [Helicobacter pylori 2018]|nr:hypothetical protein hp2017_0087 [Helicobacter pylori 2017]ADZ50764.1 hypothetical protein hp2018_0090 [Helicobacter pylori 2018]